MDCTRPATKPCRTCGEAVPPNAPFGHCPRCLIELGFGPGEPEAEASGSGVGLFGEYQLLEQIGRGGMGVVYKARQVALNRLVALKMLGSHASAFPEIAGRIRLEAEAAGSLHHPHIVTIYDIGEHEGQPFFSMELIEGGNIAKFIGPEGFDLGEKEQVGKPSSPERQEVVARVLSQVARAVDYAHKHGVLHRDLKPANILIDAKGDAHLTDFGLAKVIGRTGAFGTASGAIMGTPAYMAPEQAAGDTKHASTAADIYSMGAILYEMLTGRPPFREHTPLETLRRVVEEEPKHPTTLNVELDRDLATICLKCLQKNPQDRYATAVSLAEDLERWSRGEPIEARPVRPAERFWRWCRRQPRLAGMTVGLFLLLVAVAVLGLTLYRGATARFEKAEKLRKRHRDAVLSRIEKQWEGEGRTPIESIRITAEELAWLMNREFPGGETPVVFGLHMRAVQPPEVIQRLAPLVAKLQPLLGNEDSAARAFEVKIYASRLGLVSGLLTNEVDLMRADPAAYVLARHPGIGVIPLVQQVYAGGKSELRSAIFVRQDSAITNLEQIKGKSFAFGEEGSAVGDYLVKAELVAAGLRDRDFQGLTNLHSMAVLAAVSEGSVAAGAADLDDLKHFKGTRFTILKELSCPNYPWVATKKLDPRVAETLKNGLLSLDDSNVLVAFDRKLAGFQPVRPSDYDALEQAIEHAKLFHQPH